MNLLIVLLATGVFCEEMIVTMEYTDYLKKHVSWEVVDYEDNIFRGWTVGEAQSLLLHKIPEYDESLPVVEPDTILPSELIRDDKCKHEVVDQKECGSCWAIAFAGMLSDRCCLHTREDHGWLSIQELVSCETRSEGCQGGWPYWALQYAVANKGLVHEACFLYKAKDTECIRKCEDGEDWKASHVCNCLEPKQCIGVDSMKTCLTTGPITATLYVSKSLFGYKSGIYECDGYSQGLHAVIVEGFSDKEGCYWIARNSWGKSWGMEGRFHIACTTCGIDGKFNNGNVMCGKVVKY